MNKQRLLDIMVSIGGMFLLLVLAYGIDSFREFTDHYYSQTFSHGFAIHVSYIAANLALSAALVIWLWLILVRSNSERWTGVILICLGLFITIYPVLYFTPLGVLYIAYRLSPLFQVYLTSGVITVAGILKLIIKPK